MSDTHDTDIICQRIKAARNALGLSQKKFAEMANLKMRGLQDIEAGNIPRELTVISICSAHNISRVWLETGEGPMFLEPETDVEMIDAWLDNCTDFEKACLLAVIKTPGGWEKLAEILGNLNKILESKKPAE